MLVYTDWVQSRFGQLEGYGKDGIDTILYCKLDRKSILIDYLSHDNITHSDKIGSGQNN